MRMTRNRDMRSARRMRDGRQTGRHGRMGDYNGYPESRSRRSDMSYSRPMAERDMHYSEQPYEYDSRYSRRVGAFDYDTYYDESDYGGGEYELSSKELREWARDLLDEVRADVKPNFTKDNIERKYKELGFTEDKLTPEEFYVTALMIETDYGDTLSKYGMNNIEVVTMLAEDWLDDKDSDLRFGEKLAAYYYEVVCLD